MIRRILSLILVPPIILLERLVKFQLERKLERKEKWSEMDWAMWLIVTFPIASYRRLRGRSSTRFFIEIEKHPF